MLLRPKTAAKIVLTVTMALIILRQTGLSLYFYEKSYEREFAYGPYTDDEVRRAVAQLRADRKPDIEPIRNDDNQSGTIGGTQVRIDSLHKCKDGLGRSFEQIRLIIVVKSSLDHFVIRQTIRNTWGWEERFSDVAIRRVFLVGLPRPFDDADLQSKIDAEQEKHMDIVQGEFVDTYFNNTRKTLLGLGWVKRYCPTAEYALFADDDYYVSVKNALRFLRRPVSYPHHLKRALLAPIDAASNLSKQTISVTRNSLDEDDDENENDPLSGGDDQNENLMYVGYRFFSKPHRWKFSKFFISLEEYPFNRFPPYITAGAYIMSQSAVAAIHYASLYVTPFRFDDVYLGILARKAGVRPSHHENFHFYKLDPKQVSEDTIAYLIAAHGFGDPERLETFWNDQRSIGNA